MTAAATSPRTLRDFASYGNLEAFNALLVPAIATYFGWSSARSGAILLVVANAALIIGLIVGAAYWWGVAARLKRRPAPMARALRLASAAQLPMLLLTVAAIAVSAVQLASHGLTLANIVAMSVTALAALEYVNYYHVQLQHFDNRRDFWRLLRGKGFKRAHLARELSLYRIRTDSRAGHVDYLARWRTKRRTDLEPRSYRRVAARCSPAPPGSGSVPRCGEHI